MDFVSFQVSWGERSGADTRRLLAIACRRGEIESRDIGAIRIGPASSTIEVRNAGQRLSGALLAASAASPTTMASRSSASCSGARSATGCSRTAVRDGP